VDRGFASTLQAISTTGQPSKSEFLHIHGYLSRTESSGRSTGAASGRSTDCRAESIIATIREQIAEYGITPEQLFGRRRAPASGTRAPVAPKYRDPKTGATWSGRGKAPHWIANAKNRDRFLIEQ
jgi:DNA-binding protein H-NS